ncbi:MULTISPECIES: recombinase family protein [unclassified Ruegeria]|uniref:recombinase family protein n=1 Tax=unclassified Ruegeria TaxID=2625375 RepID=UPI0014913064|nr:MULTISPECIES: recombinase family protein [unclassified Ruegeria]NOD86812.1 recombinase family protein [Ruegeria sp. HKCCD4318]NOE12367.1 recombinase family protein [Ruegeria sp. HKCCD4318-2]NOG09468.1 recombinase family protein [Ruegeria sp. HKCCD4315]
MSPRRKIRCAIYTRKSSEDGLDQDFNSLDAQYEACAAYVASQRHEGWTLLSGRYDDGGLSGGTLERPALQRLLEEIDAGRIDMVVVYKIDRLTRSLADFSKLVDRLEQANCSFVSVTQAFNTSSSMGRLTLNVLLSFAQFEREVTAERIRDKIAASKNKGLWMGGNLPLGYDRHPDPKARTLVVNEEEARTVRHLFGLYDELGCLRKVEERATAEGLRSKRVVRTDGSVKGDCPLSRGQIYYLLRNPVYLGKIRHKDKIWDGQHPAIIDQDIWDRVQEKMRQASNRSRARGDSDARQRSTDPGAWLTGLLYDETGDRLTPTHTTRKGRRLRYYISNRLISGGKDISGWRLPGPALEHAVMDVIVRHLQDAAAAHQVLAQPVAGSAEPVQTSVADLVTRLLGQGCQIGAALLAKGKLARGQIDLEFNHKTLASALGIAADHLHPDLTHVTASFDLRRRGVEAKVIAGDMAPQPDPHLRSMLIRAHGWARDLKAGVQLMEIARRESVPDAFIRTRAQLAFLSPKIQTAILDGTQPPELTLKRLVSVTHPLEWSEQERLFGF